MIGMGANLGDPLRQFLRAMDELRTSVDVQRVSSVYLTSPVGPQDQPDFHNLVLLGCTILSPDELLAELMRIESSVGRRRGVRDGPRHLDLDLLAYGARVEESPTLTLPHPRLHLRRFVLDPLAEIAPEWRHPVSGLSATALLDRADGDEKVIRLGAFTALTASLERSG